MHDQERDRCMLVQLVRKSFLNLMFIQYTTLLMSHLEYISAHNLPSGSPSAHTAIKHLQSPLTELQYSTQWRVDIISRILTWYFTPHLTVKLLILELYPYNNSHCNIPSVMHLLMHQKQIVHQPSCCSCCLVWVE